MAAKEAELALLRPQFQQLKDDFLFNEGVLKERDTDLDAAEARVRQLEAEMAAASMFRDRAGALVDQAQSELADARQRCAPHCQTRARLRLAP